MATPVAIRSSAGKTLTNTLFPCFVLLIALGYGLLYHGLASRKGSELSSDRALFHAVNAATATGFAMNIGVGQMNAVGLTILLVLMIGGTLFSLIVGGLAVVRILRLGFSDKSIIWASLTACGGAYALGTAGAVATGQDIFDAFFAAVSAFGNVGLLSSAAPPVTSPIVQFLLLPLAVLGGLGITVLMELATALRQPNKRKSASLPQSRLSSHANAVLVGSAVVYLLGVGILLVIRWPGGEASAGVWRSTLASCSTWAINTRSLGLPIEWVGTFERPVQWLVMLLMAIGAGSAGAAGGLKLSTLAVLGMGTRKALMGQSPGRSFGIAAVWLGLFIAMVLIGQLLLLHFATDMPGDRTLFLSISAVSNAGLSHDPLTQTGPPLYVLSTLMFAGKVTPLLILWWQADSTTDAQLAVG